MEMLDWVKYSRSLGFSFEGRARRREFWWNFLFWELIVIACTLVIMIFKTMLILLVDSYDAAVVINTITQGILSLISLGIGIGMMLPLYVRRLHDIGMSGWIYLACVVGSFCCCIGGIVLIVLMCMDSKPGDNQYGPNPKGIIENNRYGGTNGGYY